MLKYFISIILLLCFELSAQKVSIKEILKSQTPDTLSLMYEQAADVWIDDIDKSSLVKQFEFRTETDRFDLDRQEYTFRTSFNALQNSKKYSQYQKSNIGEYYIKAKEFRGDSEVVKYQQIIDLIYTWKEAEFLAMRRSIIKDKKRVSQKTLASDPEKGAFQMIGLESEIIDYQVDSLRLNTKIDQLNRSLAIGKNQGINTANLISIEQLNSTFQSIEQYNETHPEIEQQELRIRANELRLDYEQNKDNQVLDFFQLRYSKRNNLSPLQSFNLGLGLILPTGKYLNKTSYDNIKLDLIESELEKAETVVSINKETQELRNKFDILYAEYTFLINESNSAYTDILTEKTPSWVTNPMDILELKEKAIEKEINKLEIEQELYQYYIDLLEIRSIIFQHPDKNYLHPTWENL